MKVEEEQLTEGYARCSKCSYDKASVHHRKAITKSFWNDAEPECLSVTCLGCDHKTFVKVGTMELKSTYFGGP